MVRRGVEPPMRYYMTEIWTPTWRQSIAWYTTLLGLRLVLDDPANEFALLETTDGIGRLAIRGGHATRDVGRGAIRLVYEVSDLNALIVAWVQKGAEIEGPHQSEEGYRSIKIHDPDGTPITVFEWGQTSVASDHE